MVISTLKAFLKLNTHLPNKTKFVQTCLNLSHQSQFPSFQNEAGYLSSYPSVEEVGERIYLTEEIQIDGIWIFYFPFAMNVLSILKGEMEKIRD